MKNRWVTVGLDVLIAGVWAAIGATITLSFAAVYYVGGSSHSSWEEAPTLVVHGMRMVLQCSPVFVAPIFIWIRVVRAAKSVRVAPANRRASLMLLGICFYTSWPISFYLHDAAHGVDSATLNECFLNFFDPRLLVYSFPFLLCTVLLVNLPNLLFRRFFEKIGLRDVRVDAPEECVEQS